MTGGPAGSAGQTITFAGTGSAGSTNGAGTSATFNNTLNTAVDAAGNVYVADAGNHMVRKITPAGVVSTLAGSGLPGYADGTGATAVFQHPSALTVDATGNVFVSDQQNHRIRKITPAGVVTTFAGSGSAGAVDGTGTSASFNLPIGLDFDPSGNLYVADYGNNKIRKITAAGVVSTFAGTGAQGLTNGAALSATFKNPMGLTIDALGTIYVADRQNYVVRKISGGSVSILAGSGAAGSSDGTGTAASFNRPNAVTVDAVGNVYVADDNNMVVRKITPTGVVTILAGAVGTSGFVNGTGANTRFNSPYGLSVDAMGYLYVADQNNYSIRKTVTRAYTINPALPGGLVFNEANGTISGTPTAVSVATNYQIQAFNATSSSNVVTISIAVTAASVSAVLPSQDQNYIITYSPRTELLTEAAVLVATSDRDKVRANIQYFDELGRPLQNIEWKGSPNKRDLVTPISYDAFGREDTKYLPYSGLVATSNGSYKATGITEQNSFYTTPGTTSGWASGGVIPIPGNAAVSKTIFEASPLNRVLEQGTPGAVWQPGASRTATAGRTVVKDYGANNVTTTYTTATGFAVRLYTATASTTLGLEHVRTLGGTGYYLANQLSLTVSKDENWLPADVKLGTTEEYKDKEGRVVLKRTFNKVGTAIQTLSTYYVYDDYGNLSFVLPPAANPDGTVVPTQVILDNFCYQYWYDGRQRLIEKKIPGKDWEFMVYNKLDQLVASQDIVQRAKAPQEWLISKYDAFGRVVLSGIYTHPSSTANISYRKVLQDTVNARSKHYELKTTTGIGYNNQSWPSSGITTTLALNYYDKYTVPGLPTVSPYNLGTSYSNAKTFPTVSKINVLGTTHMLWQVNYYDKKGRLARLIKQHYKGAATTVDNYDDIINSYNFSGDVVASTRTHYVNGVSQLYVANAFTYDHMGRAKDTRQKTGDLSTTTNPEVLLSRQNYNEIGQLSSKQLHSVNLTTPVFAQTVSYGYNARGWLKSQGSALFNESLNYEEVIAGVTTQYNGNISRQQWGPVATPTLHNYTYTYDRVNRLTSANSDEGHNEQLGYDFMGNISRLQRKKTNALEDQLKYTYTTGNRLASVVDSTASVNTAFQLSGTTAYTYNANGNMLTRSNTVNAGNNLSAITYNHMNLPSTLTAGTAAIVYTYDAAGNKLRKQVASASINNEYITGINYEGGVLKFVSTPEGRVVRNSATSYTYEFTLSDHLGNGRVYFDINGTAARKIQEVDYYAFGLDIQRSLIGTENKYQYNGKEKQDQEKMFDYGARFYDPVIGRFSTLDPYSEFFPWMTNYQYGSNSPSSKIDLDGLEGIFFFENTSFVPTEFPLESAVGDLAKAGGELSGEPISVPGSVEVASGAKFEWHHLIPQAFKNTIEAVKQAVKEGFDFDGEENLTPQEKFVKNTGKGVHGNHPKYNNAIKGQIQNAIKANPNASPLDIVRAVANNARQTINNNPGTKINNLYSLNFLFQTQQEKPTITIGVLSPGTVLPDSKPAPKPKPTPKPKPKSSN
jgi:RHS repeat-associated protein